jgi:hypothetical protein
MAGTTTDSADDGGIRVTSITPGADGADTRVAPAFLAAGGGDGEDLDAELAAFEADAAREMTAAARAGDDGDGADIRADANVDADAEASLRDAEDAREALEGAEDAREADAQRVLAARVAALRKRLDGRVAGVKAGKVGKRKRRRKGAAAESGAAVGDS